MTKQPEMAAVRGLELESETRFKDAVLLAAQAKATQLVQSARDDQQAQLAAARKKAAAMDYEAMKAEALRRAERELARADQNARDGLLARRTELAAGLFAEVVNRLGAFANGVDYPAWLQARLMAAAANCPAGAALTAWVRPADAAHIPALQKAVPGLVVQTSPDILLGGLLFTDGHLFFDETLDRRLADEQRRFYDESGLSV